MKNTNKKGNVSVSLSWVFMIVIGTFFLVLSYNIIDKYQDNEQTKYEIELKQALRNIFNNVGRTAGIEENSLEPIGNIFTNSEVKILCEQGFPILSLNGELDANNEFLQNYPVFMTYIEQGEIDQTYLGVESFRLPFKISNMLAIVSKKNKIVFDKNSAVSEKIHNKFSKSSYNDLNFDTEDFTDLSLFESKNEKLSLNSVVFVSDVGTPLSGINIEDLDYEVSLVQIEETSDNSGRIIIFDKDRNSKQYNYIDYNSAFGLITMSVLSSPDTFDCSYNLIIDSIPPVYDFYIRKTDYLINQSKTQRLCSSSLLNKAQDGSFDGSEQVALYQDLKTSLTNIKLEVEANRFDNLGILSNLLFDLETKSKNLERFSCEYVY